MNRRLTAAAGPVPGGTGSSANPCPGPATPVRGRTRATRRRLAASTALALLVSWAGGAAPGHRAGDGPPRRWREPVALAASPDGKWLYAANRAGGSVSVIDIDGRRVEAEWDVGGSPADLAATPDGRLLLVADERGDRLVVLEAKGPEVSVLGSVGVAKGPVGVVATKDGGRAVVASLWPRRLTIVDLADPARPAAIGDVPLPFEPRCVLVIDDRAIVADAFGGMLAVVHLDSLQVESSRELPAHNIRGLALTADGRRLLLTHQVLNRSARTEFNDVHWGSLLTNNVRSLPLAAVLDPSADPVRDGTLLQLGDAGEGSGDPNGVAVLPDGRVAVALGGVDKVAVGPESEPAKRRIDVGRRPVALAPAGGSVAVANAFADSVSLVPLDGDAPPVEIALGPHPEADDARLGRSLFYDARLSHDGWLSCHSCHADGHTGNRLADTLGDGTFGTPKRTLSLLGVGETGPWAWDGSVDQLGDQIRKSIRVTMQGAGPSDDQVQAIEAYLRTLAPPPAPATDDARSARGEAAFRRLRCDRCHAPPTYTTPKTYDVGLADESGARLFNPPSLRGVGRRPGLFHDARARSLREVFSRFEHQLDGPLPADDLDDLLSFLRGL